MSNKPRGKTQTKCVEKLVRNFHTDFEAGLTITQIADKYYVTKSYIYKLLEKIAKQNGVKREYYLEREHATHTSSEYDRNTGFTHYNDEMFQNIMKSFDNLHEDISTLRSKLEAFKQEINNKEDEECQL